MSREGNEQLIEKESGRGRVQRCREEEGLAEREWERERVSRLPKLPIDSTNTRQVRLYDFLFCPVICSSSLVITCNRFTLDPE